MTIIIRTLECLHRESGCIRCSVGEVKCCPSTGSMEAASHTLPRALHLINFEKAKKQRCWNVTPSRLLSGLNTVPCSLEVKNESPFKEIHFLRERCFKLEDSLTPPQSNCFYCAEWHNQIDIGFITRGTQARFSSREVFVSSLSCALKLCKVGFPAEQFGYSTTIRKVKKASLQ